MQVYSLLFSKHTTVHVDARDDVDIRSIEI